MFIIILADGAGTDYLEPPPAERSIVFPIGSVDNTTDCLNISALDDDDFESPEFFTVSLESPVSSGGVALGSPSSAFVNIEDNESKP